VSLLAVNRGFATTSIASKKAPQGDLLIPEGEGGPALDTAPDSASAPPGTQTPARSGKDSALANGPTGSLVASTNVKEDWEDEKVIEEAALQGLVERLQDKGEKEVARVLKVMLTPIRRNVLMRTGY